MAFQGRQAVLDATNAKDWKKRGHGFIEDRKPDNSVRVLLENYNSLQYFSDAKERSRIKTIGHTRCRLQADAIVGIEPQTDWTIAKQEEGDGYRDLFGLGEDRKSVCAHNATEQMAKSQYGGTCMMAFGVFSSHIKSVNLEADNCKDRRSLGSYCSLVTTGKLTKPARIVTYYRPNDESRHKAPKKGRQTVSTQHMREFKRQGKLGLDPRLEANRCLVEDLKAWKAQGEEIILLGNFNQSIYNSVLATALTGPGLDMKEQYKYLYDEEAPYLHMSGQLLIMGCYATSGIEIKAYFISRHHAHGRVGDHRLHVIDFTTQSILGIDLPTMNKRSGRKLQWKIKLARKKYTRDLIKMSKAHKLDAKANRLVKPARD